MKTAHVITFDSGEGYIWIERDEDDNITDYPTKREIKVVQSDSLKSVKRYVGDIYPKYKDESKYFAGWKIEGSDILYVKWDDDLQEGEKCIYDYVPTHDTTFVAQYSEDW